MSAKRNVLGKLTIGGLLVFGAQACGMQDSKNGDYAPLPQAAGMEETSFPLLTTGCTIDGTTGNATFSLAAGETIYLFKRAADGVVVANANVGASTTECTFATTKKITIASAVLNSNVHKVILDFYGGAFGQATAAAGVAVGTGPNIVVTLGTGTGNSVKVRGTANPDILTFGTVSTTSFGSFSLGTSATVPAARTYPDLSMTGVTDLTVVGGPGVDSITGQGGTPVGGTAIVAATGVTASALSGAINMAAYGGDGNDTITSGGAGAAINNLYGNAGNDTFLQQPALAKDVISGTDSGGASDVDVVDYSRRSAALSVTLGDDLIARAAYGYVDCVDKAHTTDNDYFTIDDGPLTKTYEYQKTADVLATGSITVTGIPADNDTFVLNDGVNAAATFHFTQSANAATYGAANPSFPADSIIDVSTAVTNNDVAVATFTAINAYATTSLTVDATNPGVTSVVPLTNSAALGASTVNQAITDGSTALTIVGMAGGSHFTPVGGGRVVIDISGGGVSTDVQVALATASAISGGGQALTASRVRATDSYVTVTSTTLGVKPATAAITKNTGAFSVTDFNAGSAAPGSNDGASGETDSINADIESVIGGSGADTIDASLSTLVAHTLHGMDGNDVLTGSALADTIYGGKGNDTLNGSDLVDTMKGGDGDDIMQGGTGNDNIDGGGVNCLVGSSTVCVTAAAAVSAVAGVNPGLNTIDYSDRSAAVTVNLGSLSGTVGETGELDVVTASSIAYIRGGSGADTLTGDANNNIIWGGGRGDTIAGGLGNDALYGEAGDDTIDGGGGVDFLSGGAWLNTLTGGTENDLIDNSSGAAGTIDCGLGDADVAIANGSESSNTNCEN